MRLETVSWFSHLVTVVMLVPNHNALSKAVATLLVQPSSDLYKWLHMALEEAAGVSVYLCKVQRATACIPRANMTG